MVILQRTSAAALVVLLSAVGVVSAEIRFKHHFIDDDGPEGDVFSATMLGDLDQDGRMDVVVGRSRWGGGPRHLYWYRNLGRIDCWSDPMVANRQAACGCGGVVLDIDRDGWPDIVSDGWYRNPAPPAADREFLKRDGFLSGLNAEIHDTETADFNGDGLPDVVVHMQHGQPGVYVYLAPANPDAEWPRVTALRPSRRMSGNRGRSAIHAAISPRGCGDIDGDGDTDIVFCGSWLENADGEGRTWTEHANIDFTRMGKWGMAVRCWVVDMDKDGRNDFVQAECDMPEARVAWFRNVEGDGSRWEMHQLPYNGVPGDFHSLAVADFDLDGDWDVYVDEMEHLHVPQGREGRIGMIVWENIDGKGRSWRQHVVVQGLGGHQVQIADLDGDGDTDIVTRPYKPRGNVNGGRMHVSVLENLTRNPNATGSGSGIGPDSAPAVVTVQPSTERPRPARATTARKPTQTSMTHDLDQGLIAHWTFDDLDDQIATFDEDHGHVDAGGLDVPGTAITLAARIRVDSFGGGGQDGRILSKATGVQEQDHYWMISTWRVGKTVRLRFRLKAGGATSTLVASSGDIKLGTWSHIAAVYDGRMMRLYMNGKEIGATEKAGEIDVDPKVAVWIGDNPPVAGSRPFRGRMDDVRIYRRALTSAEISALSQ